MSSIAGVKDEIRVDGETKIGGFRFQKYLQDRVVHIHNPEDQKGEYPIKDFLKESDRFLVRLKDLREGETIKLKDLSVTLLFSGILTTKKVELELFGCKDTIDLGIFHRQMKEFFRLLEK